MTHSLPASTIYAPTFLGFNHELRNAFCMLKRTMHREGSDGAGPVAPRRSSQPKLSASRHQRPFRILRVEHYNA